MADVYLQLILDEKVGVAFIASIDENSYNAEEGSKNKEDPVSLINKRTLSLYDTLLLLVLRKYYQDREALGEQTVAIDVERIASNLTPFLSLTIPKKLQNA